MAINHQNSSLVVVIIILQQNIDEIEEREHEEEKGELTWWVIIIKWNKMGRWDEWWNNVNGAMVFQCFMSAKINWNRHWCKKFKFRLNLKDLQAWVHSFGSSELICFNRTVMCLVQTYLEAIAVPLARQAWSLEPVHSLHGILAAGQADVGTPTGRDHLLWERK